MRLGQGAAAHDADEHVAVDHARMVEVVVGVGGDDERAGAEAVLRADAVPSAVAMPEMLGAA